MDLVLKAARIAKFAHRNQLRKYAPPGQARKPYISHPADVSNYLILNADVLTLRGFSPNTEEIIAGAWLHDVLKDSDTDPFFIDQVFNGTLVPLYVRVLTKSHSESKSEYIERLRNESESTRAIKMADRICNLRDSMYAPQDFKDYYRKQSVRLLESIGHGMPEVFVWDFNSAIKGL